jgi:high affinity Mn2+ porin
MPLQTVRMLLLCLLTAAALPLWAQSQPESESSPPESPVTLFPHSDSDRYWISGQANLISQWHPPFHSPYQGANSLTPQAQEATTHVLTLFLAYRPARWTQLVLDVEDATGGGFSHAVGLAGYTNFDAVRVSQGVPLSQAPYVARALVRQVIPLSERQEVAERSPLNLWSALPAYRVEIWFGKFSLTDFFDQNGVVGDDHLGFMNWTVLNNGAYDYAANTRGYTDGVLVALEMPRGALRFAEVLMPKFANGIFLEADLRKARSENAELELRLPTPGHQKARVRFLGYVNHANMGSYARAVDALLARQTSVPDITAHPPQVTTKYGFGVNLEQPLTEWIGLFGRWGWNEGQHESFAFTEVDQTIAAGVAGSGQRWGRREDRFGAALVSNGISRIHQLYLQLGGSGFQLGDGRLRYAREEIGEVFYTAHLWRGLFPALDLQAIGHPGYNVDRGPVFVVSLRLHVEF